MILLFFCQSDQKKIVLLYLLPYQDEQRIKECSIWNFLFLKCLQSVINHKQFMSSALNQSQQFSATKKEDISLRNAENQLDISRISEKIEMMKQSVAQLSVYSKRRNMDMINRLYSQHQKHADFVEQEQRKLMLQLSSFEDRLSQLERAKMEQSSQISNTSASLEQAIASANEEIRDHNSQNISKFQEYRDQIMNMKIQLAEIELLCKEKIAKFNRESLFKLTSCEKGIEKYEQQCKSSKIQKLFKSIKALKSEIDEDQIKQNNDLKRLGGQLKQLDKLINSRISEEEKRHKDGFSQNYNALQELFVFISEQYGVQK